MDNNMSQPKYDAIATECQKIRTFLDQSPGFLKMWGSGYSFSVPAFLPYVPEDTMSRTLTVRGGMISQANRDLGGSCSSLGMFPPQSIPVLLMLFRQEIHSHPDILQLQHWCQQAGFHWALIETYDDCVACALAASGAAADEEPHAMHLPLRRQFTIRVEWGDTFGQDFTVICEGQEDGFPILEDEYRLLTSTSVCLTTFLTWPTLTPLERQLLHEAHTAFIRLPARTPGLYASMTIALRSTRASDEQTRCWEITISDDTIDLQRICLYQYERADQTERYTEIDLVFRFASDGTHYFYGDPWQWIADMAEVLQATPQLKMDLKSYAPPSPPSERGA